jgi:hypothetical protein
MGHGNAGAKAESCCRGRECSGDLMAGDHLMLSPDWA